MCSFDSPNFKLIWILPSDIKTHTEGNASKTVSAARVSEDGYCLLVAKTILGSSAPDLSLGTL